MLRIKILMVSLVLVFVLSSGSMVRAQEVSVKLQEGIYQETTGNLDAAMAIYAEIIEHGDSTDTQAATAMFRLGMCQLMAGDKEKAALTFGQVITRYPEENSVVEKARDQLDKLNIGLIGKVIQVSSPEDLQAAIDAAEPNDTIIMGKGTYTKPIKINKPITLRGTSRTDCVFEVTADQPAILIDTKEKGIAKLENLTIKFRQLTSELANLMGRQAPSAVDVVDSKAVIEGCFFKALGSRRQSPWGVTIKGFSYLAITRCRFEGDRSRFEEWNYAITYSEGTRGKVQDCLIIDPGHQGVMLYPGAEVDVIGNVVCGSRFHGVRSHGGRLNMENNLIVENQNRGVYLGDISATGSIINNVIMGNTIGIGGYKQSRVNVANNIITGNDSSGVNIHETAELTVQNNIFHGNERAILLIKVNEVSENSLLNNMWDIMRGRSNKNSILLNTLWENGADFKNFVEEPNSIIKGESCFVDFDNGNFALTNPAYTALNQGLTDPEIFIMLWNRWKNRTDPNEPFVIIW